MKQLFLISSLFILSLGLSAQTIKALNQQVLELYKKGDYVNALQLAEKTYAEGKRDSPESDPEFITTVFALATLYKQTKQYEKAEPLFMQVVEMKRKTVGNEHPQFLFSLTALVSFYSGTGQFEKAVPVAIKAAETAIKINGENSKDHAMAASNLGFIYFNLKKNDKAEEYYLRSATIKKAVYGEKHAEYASMLFVLGNFYMETGQFNKAEQDYQKALAIRKTVFGEEHEEYTLVLNELAILYSAIGQYQKSEQVRLEEIAITKKLVGENHPDYATSLSNLATHYTLLARYNEAESLNIRAKEIRKNVLGDNSIGYAISLINLGGLYSDQGQYEKAEPLIRQAIAIREKLLGKGHIDYAAGLNALAILQLRLGAVDKAIPLFEEVLTINRNAVGEDRPGIETALNNLAYAYLEDGQLEKAELFHIRAVDASKKIFGEKDPKYALSLNNLAMVYKKKMEYDKAEAMLKKVLEIKQGLVGEGHPDYAASLNNLAMLYVDKKEYARAEQLYNQILGICKKTLTPAHPYYHGAIDNMAMLKMDMEQYDTAAILLSASTKIDIDKLKRTFSILSEKEKAIYISSKFLVADYYNSVLFYHRKISPAFYIENYDLQLFLKSLTLADTRNVLDAIRSNTDTTVRQLFSTWQANRSFLAKQQVLPVADRDPGLANTEDATENIEKELGKRSARFRNQQKAMLIKMQDVQEHLAADEAAVEFVSFNLYHKKPADSVLYAAYVLRKQDAAPVFVPLFEMRQLQKLFDSAGTTATSMVNMFYRGTDLKNKTTSISLGKDLYDLVWAPLEPHLEGIKKISYTPAGKLFSIAFHALPVDSTTVLMDKYRLQQFTSTRQVALREKGKQNNQPGSITLFGNASFTLDSVQLAKGKEQKEKSSTSSYLPYNRGNRGGTWTDLPGTAAEVDTINNFFQQNKILSRSFTQANASEENLKALSGNAPQILHIATHGFFLPAPGNKKNESRPGEQNAYTLADDPLLRTGLILSGGNYAWSGKTPIEGVEDGIATAYEISQLNLSGTELVVLSACETALGDVKGSEGVFGLQRAFKMAGVKKMIVSLWQVPDKETAELMTAFYSYWLKGKTIDQAFAMAQSDMRKKYPPFYWAAFVMLE